MKDLSENLYKTAIEQLAFESGLPTLFLRRAYTLFENEKYEEALLEVKRGLKDFPGHPPAYYLLIKIFIELKKPNLAEITLNSASKFFADGELTAYYRGLIDVTISEIENKNDEELRALSTFSIPESEPEPEVVAESTEEEEVESDSFLDDSPLETHHESDTDLEVEDTIEGSYHNIQSDSFSDLTDQPEAVESIADTPVTSHENEIVTAGMAIIYARQGNTHKAIEIFSKLIEKEPEKKESYEKIISLLKSKSQQV